MRTMEWKVLMQDNKIGIVEHGFGFNASSVEDQLTIIGLLEDMKQTHLEKLKVLFNRTKSEKDL